MAADEVRRLSIADVLVDTGAMSLCLPIDIVQRLGLPKLRDVMVTTATGDGALELYDYARIENAGRSALFDCVALPVGSVPLLGVLPLEALGLEPDLLNQRLRLLPETGRGGRYFAMSPIIY
jgi:predicted aspartyl protease